MGERTEFRSASRKGPTLQEEMEQVNKNIEEGKKSADTSKAETNARIDTIIGNLRKELEDVKSREEEILKEIDEFERMKT